KNRQRIKICQYGLPYIGTTFVLGGGSLKNGIDCSTFARRAMRNAGVNVSSSALAVNLSNSGRKIKRSQLKPGDMVFYYNSYKDKRIGHCAIYIGEGYIINASGHQGHYYPSGGIRISRIDYRKPTAVKFRNLVGN
ncbi:MAG: NlpC/P60 family protein, partial [Lachnospiraceae bacterium]|nr:NlpC/P60 family protein [Lachnospiraceae bacterium]